MNGSITRLSPRIVSWFGTWSVDGRKPCEINGNLRKNMIAFCRNSPPP